MRKDNRRVRSRSWAVLSLALGLAACGRPAPPDLRGEMTGAVSRLGVRPIYPLNESFRIGSVHLVDASVARPFGSLPPWQETSLLLTEELVEPFETARTARHAVRQRYPQSGQALANFFKPGDAGQLFYRQEPPPSAGAAPNGALPLAAMPGFQLASVDQTSFGAFLPDLVASFFVSLGLRSTSYLRMEALGVELAEIPLDDMRLALATACGSGVGSAPQFRGGGGAAYPTVADGVTLLEAQRANRAEQRRWGEEPPIKPMLALVRRVFYLRGVRFVVEDSRVASVFAQAALANRFPEGRTPVSINFAPATTPLSPAPPSGGPAPAAGAPAVQAAANAAAITALDQKIEQLRTALAASGGTSTQLAATAARATATGIELIQLFDRPLAFGYQAVFTDAETSLTTNRAGKRVTTSTGFKPLCDRVAE